MRIHNSQGIIFPLMVGVHDISPFLRQQFLAGTLGFNPSVSHHNGNTSPGHSVTSFFGEAILKRYADPDTEEYKDMVERIGKQLNFTSLCYHRLDDTPLWYRNSVVPPSCVPLTMESSISKSFLPCMRSCTGIRRNQCGKDAL